MPMSALALLALTVSALATAGARAQKQPACAAVTTTTAHPQAARGPNFFNVAFRVRCNFRVTRLHLKASRSLVRVLRHPVLEHPDAGDRLACARLHRKTARCIGDVGERVRIIGELKVRGGPCARPHLRVRFSGFGGEDCDQPGTGCPLIGYSAKKRVTHTRGCA
jgi:hypothetical protein